MGLFDSISSAVKDAVEDAVDDVKDEASERAGGSEGIGGALMGHAKSFIASSLGINDDGVDIERDDDPEDEDPPVELSQLDGHKRALFVGINYFGSKAELRGCINDVDNIKAYVTSEFGFSDVRVLTDDDKNDGSPTKANMLEAMRWLVSDAKKGDSLFFHYSGHGGTSEDVAPDTDEADGQDETLIPVDYQSAGQIVDDTIHELMVKSLPAGVRLTCVMDCCHSGSVFDLPYQYTIDGKLTIHEKDNRKEAMQMALQAGMTLVKGKKEEAMALGMKAIKGYMAGGKKPDDEAHKRQIQIRSTLADVIQLSGCRDDQTSADAHINEQATGAMSWGLLKALREHGKDQSYVDLLKNLRDNLQGKYTQVPQMSTGHRMDMKSTFGM